MVVAFEDLAAIRQKHAGKKIVLASGVFDLLHSGHIAYLQGLRKHGDIVVVMVKGDERVRSGKGPTRPIISESDRAIMVDAVKGVDYVFVAPNYPFQKTSAAQDKLYLAVFGTLQPDVFHSTNSFWSGLKELGVAKIIITERPEGQKMRSTTDIIERIKTLYQEK